MVRTGDSIRVRLPDDQVIAVGLHSDHMFGLDIHRGCVDQGFHTDLGASRVKALCEDAIVISRATPLPHRQVNTVGNTKSLWKILRPHGGGVDVYFPTDLDPAGIEALQRNYQALPTLSKTSVSAPMAVQEMVITSAPPAPYPRSQDDPAIRSARH